MLKTCLPGVRYEEKPHRLWVIAPNDKKVKLPSGPHGRAFSQSLKIGDLRMLVKQFNIGDCAAKELKMPGLKKKLGR